MADNITEEDVARARNLSVEQVRAIKAVRLLSERQILELPQPALIHVLLRSQYLDMPQRRQTFRASQEVDEHGPPTPDARFAALTHLDTARQRLRSAPQGLVATESDLQRVGQAYLNATWSSLGPGATGGRTRSIVIHPTSPDKILAGSVSGGIWRSDNGGTTWSSVSDVLMPISCLAMDPSNPDIIYAGTGEGFYNSDAVQGFGILRGGWQDWHISVRPRFGLTDFQYINRLAVSHDGAVLLAATRTGLFRSTDGQGGVWYPTPLRANNAWGMLDVKFHPTDPNKAIVSTLGSVARSTDGGQTWTPAAPVPPYTQIGNHRVELAYAVGNPSTIYASACTAIFDNQGNIIGWKSSIWRSTDEGATFGLQSTGDYLRTQGWYANAIWAGDPDQKNTDFIVVGGLDLWKSLDGGVNLTQISDSTKTGSVHADHHAIVSHPAFSSTNKTVFFGNDGGLYKTTDISTAGNDSNKTNGWTCLNHGYSATQFYSAAGNAASGRIVGGAQDNGTLVYSGNADTWSLMFSWDGGVCASDPGDPNYFYGEYVHLRIFRSTDAGNTADYICGINSQATSPPDTWKQVPYQIPDAMADWDDPATPKAVHPPNTAFIAPFVLDPGNSNRILAGGLSLWRTNDAKTANTTATGPSWERIKTPIPANKVITAIAIAPGNSDIVWVGYDNGEIHASNNGTASPPAWQKVFTASPVRSCTRLGFGSDTNTVYACFGGFVPGNIQKTADGGTTWTDVSNGLAAAPIRAVTIHPTRVGLMFAGTELGMFISTDGGASWSPTTKGPNASPVYDLIWLGTKLIAVTHGRGMYSIVPSATAPKVLHSPSAPVQIGNDVHILYRDENNHISDIYNSGQWSYQDLTTLGVPALQGDPCAINYTDGTHVFFVCGNNRLAHLLYHNTTWRYQDLTIDRNGIRLPPMEGDPFACRRTWNGRNLNVFCRDVSHHLWWLYYLDPIYLWDFLDLGNAPDIYGDPCAVVFGGSHTHIFYRDVNNHIWDFYGFPGQAVDVTAATSGATAAGDPRAIVYQNKLHVVFRDTVNHLADFSWDGGQWTYTDVTQVGRAGVWLTGDPFPIVFSDTLHVLYRGGRETHRIIADSSFSTSWSYNELNAAAGAGTDALAEGDPIAAILNGNELHVLYRGVDGHVSDLWYGQSWGYRDLTLLVT